MCGLARRETPFGSHVSATPYSGVVSDKEEEEEENRPCKDQKPEKGYGEEFILG